MQNNEIRFSNEDINLENYAALHPGYTKIYMNASKNGTHTEISLSKQNGEFLYIVSNYDAKYCEYFKQAWIPNAVTCVDDLNEIKPSNPKKMKQSTLFDFMKK
ncbi:hypothetical protein CWI42_091910 [Ordospora colligata]|uniref:Uncharacterized protein n=1 Tax=Ordospora colligata OC4 TaxID=1354746 RepID=A0A0B2UIX8_9MICR|nr:uncharacterized protein M896_091930 [Ordospora colligata OC4]KHN69263.1 hypothetical protein M896_091930 [Ordospora colligata OC4]TBU14441.1 hypothetical protein CWI40_091920 [Ordospora colligata]TBU14718.1 hypothetical protein CWI41_091930 [Ordospora colligata]TBU18103.1 hypothetical protein CWI42_091910 [Ordospora colligata]